MTTINRAGYQLCVPKSVYRLEATISTIPSVSCRLISTPTYSSLPASPPGYHFFPFQTENGYILKTEIFPGKLGSTPSLLHCSPPPPPVPSHLTCESNQSWSEISPLSWEISIPVISIPVSSVCKRVLKPWSSGEACHTSGMKPLSQTK